MAVTLTSRSSTTSQTTAVQTLASASFTPTAAAKLFAFAICVNDGHTTSQSWSCSGGSLSWTKEAESTQVAYGGDANYGSKVVLYSATVGGSPGSMTVTVDAFSGTNVGYYSLSVFEANGDTTPSLAQAVVVNSTSEGGGNTESHTSESLAGAATTGNRVVACFGVGTEEFGAASATPASWSALVAQAQNFSQVAVFHRNDFTGTSVTCSDLGNQVYAVGAILFELTDDAGGTDGTATPAVIAVTTTVPAVTKQAGATPTPAAIAVTSTLPAATAQASHTATPAAVAATTTVPAVTTQAGSAPTPAAIAVPVTIPAATPLASSTSTPAATAVPVTLPAVTATGAGNATATPATIAATVTVPAVTTAAGAVVAPDEIAVTVTIPEVSASGSDAGTATPAAITATATILAATPQAGSTAAPTVIAIPVTLPAATTQAGAAPTPATIDVTVSLAAVTTAAGSTAAPATVTIPVTIPAATAFAGSATATPDAIDVVVTLHQVSAGEPVEALAFAITVTVRDHHHTATVKDAGQHTATVRHGGHTATTREQR